MKKKHSEIEKVEAPKSTIWKQAAWIDLLYWNDFTDWNEKKIIEFLPTSGITSWGISQGKIIQ